MVSYFKDVLGKNGKVFASNSVKTSATSEVNDFLITPLIYDEEYIPSLLKFCLKNYITNILSVFDIDLLVLARNSRLFEQYGINVLLAKKESVEICNDKWKTYLFLEKLNINTPKTYLNLQDTFYAIKNGEISFPIVIKPRWGMVSVGVYIADSVDELYVLSSKCQGDILNSHIK